MTSATWTFSPLSCSLMSLLASRTHEWTAWTIAEGGLGEVKPENVSWVEVRAEMSGTWRSVRSSDLASAQALEIFANLQKSPPVLGATSPALKLIWQSAGFLSEVLLADLPPLPAASAWRLERGSEIRPTLYHGL